MNLTEKKVVFLSLIGAVFSFLTLLHHIDVNSGNATASFCSINEFVDCDSVARSPYATVFGIPEASLGLWFFSVLGLGTLFWSRWARDVETRATDGEPVTREWSTVLDVLWLFGFLALIKSIVMASISVFVLRKVCLYCMLLYLVCFCLAFVTYKGRRTGTSWRQGLRAGVFGLGRFAAWSLKPPRHAAEAGVISRLSLLAAGLLFAVIVSFPSVVAEVRQDRPTPGKSLPVGALQMGVEGHSPWIGYPDAELVVQEFSDFQCPYCRRGAEITKQLLADYPGRIKVVFRHFPLDMKCNRAVNAKFHDAACLAARAAQCAAVQGAPSFWKLHDDFFAAKFSTEQEVKEIISSADVNQTALNECIERNGVLPDVQADVEQALQYEINGTPTFVVQWKSERRILNANDITPYVRQKLRQPS